jgi:hypothetical protein
MISYALINVYDVYEFYDKYCNFYKKNEKMEKKSDFYATFFCLMCHYIRINYKNK